MMNRKVLRQQAEILGLDIEFTKYGVPCAVNGQPITEKPWLTLQAMVLDLLAQQNAAPVAEQAEVVEESTEVPAQSEQVVAESEVNPANEGEVVAECPASIPTQPAPALNHVTPEVKPEPAKPAQPAQKHPLRGFTLSTKEKVCKALYDLKRVKLDYVRDAKVFARLLAQHFGAEVCIRVVDGLTWILVTKGSARRAFHL